MKQSVIAKTIATFGNFCNAELFKWCKNFSNIKKISIYMILLHSTVFAVAFVDSSWYVRRPFLAYNYGKI